VTTSWYIIRGWNCMKNKSSILLTSPPTANHYIIIKTFWVHPPENNNGCYIWSTLVRRVAVLDQFSNTVDRKAKSLRVGGVTKVSNLLVWHKVDAAMKSAEVQKTSDSTGNLIFQHPKWFLLRNYSLVFHKLSF